MAAGPVNKRLSSDARKNQIHRGRLVSGILFSLSLSLSLSLELNFSHSLTSLFSSSSTAILLLFPSPSLFTLKLPSSSASLKINYKKSTRRELETSFHELPLLLCYKSRYINECYWIQVQSTRKDFLFE